MRDFDEALKINTKCHEAYNSNSKGIASQILGNHSDALKAFNASLKQKADDVNIYYNRGLIFKSMNQYKSLRKSYRNKKRLKQSIYHDDRGFRHLWKNTEALEICKNAIKVSFGKNKEAINDYEEAIKILSISSEIDIILYH